MKKTAYILVTIFIILVMGVQVVLADGPLTSRFNAWGRYDIVADGVGLLGVTEGDITLNVPGTVVTAYLYWAGYNTSLDGGDDTVNFSVDGGSATSLTADYTFGPDYLDHGTDYYNYVYVEVVTSLVLTGNHIYTISGVTIDSNFGAGMMVVYEHPSLPYSIVQINDGLDFFLFDLTSPRGPNSEVLGIDFDVTTSNRDMKIVFIVGAVENESRPNAIWYQTGTGIKPTNLVDEVAATELEGPPSPYPLASLDGHEWDTYSNSITVPTGETWASFQIESVTDVSGEEGTSAVWLASGFVMEKPMLVGGVILAVGTFELLLQWIAVVSMVAIVVAAVIFKRRKRIAYRFSQ